MLTDLPIDWSLYLCTGGVNAWTMLLGPCFSRRLGYIFSRTSFGVNFHQLSKYTLSEMYPLRMLRPARHGYPRRIRHGYGFVWRYAVHGEGYRSGVVRVANNMF